MAIYLKTLEIQGFFRILGAKNIFGFCGCKIPTSETRTGDTLAQQSAARRAADAHFDVSAKRNAVAPTARQSDISPVNGRNGLIHRVSRFAFVQCPANSSRKRDELRGSNLTGIGSSH